MKQKKVGRAFSALEIIIVLVITVITLGILLPRMMENAAKRAHIKKICAIESVEDFKPLSAADKSIWITHHVGMECDNASGDDIVVLPNGETGRFVSVDPGGGVLDLRSPVTKGVEPQYITVTLDELKKAKFVRRNEPGWEKYVIELHEKNIENAKSKSGQPDAKDEKDEPPTENPTLIKDRRFSQA